LRVGPTLDRIRDEYENDVRIVWKHLPLAMHKKAPLAHAASVAAYRQGKFWEMHDLIFANQKEMSVEKYREWAAQIGLNLEQFNRDLISAEVTKTVNDDAAEAAKMGITGAPGFFVNGRFLRGAKPFEDFKKLIDEELAKS
jgi:protein-disulfide isomerase